MTFNCSSSSTGDGSNLSSSSSSSLHCGKGGTCDVLSGECLCHDGFRHSYRSTCIPEATSTTLILSFCGLALLLYMGKMTRIYARCLHFLYLPSCVVGGLYGLVILQIAENYRPAYDYLEANWVSVIFFSLTHNNHHYSLLLYAMRL